MPYINIFIKIEWREYLHTSTVLETSRGYGKAASSAFFFSDLKTRELGQVVPDKYSQLPKAAPVTQSVATTHKATNAVAPRLLDCWGRREGPTPHGRTQDYMIVYTATLNKDAAPLAKT